MKTELKPDGAPVSFQELESLLRPEPQFVWANLSNFIALLFHSQPGLNWLGVYFRRESRDELVLGPFRGRVACDQIDFQRGVCGLAARERRAVRVADVHAFPDHIVCDPSSRSEMVIPLFQGGRLVGVLDADSPELNRFSDRDEAAWSRYCEILMKKTSSIPLPP